MLHQAIRGPLVVAVCGHMGASQPPDKVSNRTVEIEESGSSHSHPVLVDRCLSLPRRVVPANRVELDITILV